MNIFVLDTDPTRAAVAHCDVHVVKMILETTQMLCTVRSAEGDAVVGGYKPTHQSHPCTRWVTASAANYGWAHRLLVGLHKTYTHRYQKTHAAHRLVAALAPRAECGEPSSFVFAGPDECVGATVVERYRALYRLKQTTMKRPMRWTKDPRPEWMDP